MKRNERRNFLKYGLITSEIPYRYIDLARPPRRFLVSQQITQSRICSQSTIYFYSTQFSFSKIAGDYATLYKAVRDIDTAGLLRHPTPG
eukprot:scaffold674836_cov79-Prasinocladus_malaysianus.AAC.1